MNTIGKNYILIVKTVHGDPEENITVSIKGSHGQTERMPLGKSQSYRQAFRDNQTDLFLLLSSIDVGKIYQVEFNGNTNAKFKEWKYNHVFVINGTHVYRDIVSEYSLLPSRNTSSVVNVSEPSGDSQESIYYAFIKTGSDSCSKEAYPKLSLFGNNQKYTEIDMKSSYRLHSPSVNNTHALQKYQFDIFQWQDCNIGDIERMRLQVYSENKQSKCQWPIEWMFVIHYDYSFTGRIILNRTMKIDRYIDIDLEQKPVAITGEFGDSSGLETTLDRHLFPSHILNKQSNAAKDGIGRYYVLLKNMEGTSGNMYIEFHGDLLSSSGEQQLLKCENYPEHPFANKHTDLFHIKALEVGHIHSISLHLDQSDKEHTITLDSLFLIHNAVMYQFNLKYLILNKEQTKKEFFPLSHSKFDREKICYYIATHTADRILSGTNVSLKVVVTGSKGMFGPVDLNESLTNGKNPFEKTCIDLFHFEDDDIGDPISMTITLEPKGTMSHLFSGAKCDRIMLIKDGAYNSLWRLLGDLKIKEPKTILLPVYQRPSVADSASLPPITPPELAQTNTTNEIPAFHPTNQLHSPEPKDSISNLLSGDYHHDDPSMMIIEDHQKRHTFAPTLYQAEQNYRELRRLLKKMNGTISTESNRTKSNKIL